MSYDALRSTRRLPVRVLLSVHALALVLLVPAVGRAADAPSVDGRERGVVNRVNAVRAQHGLAPVAIGRGRSKAALRPPHPRVGSSP